ncbi:AAA family ATPase [Acetobacterium paludosum]|uniref:Sporulation initiation inhibitor protein Soj n=1 Tax=Acetobacterium paludosum TaxID=52693 RepID=A0A923KWU5_9FIRM|nr:AAA family ATPase [Acetobacterium paludosum]MBC3888468.1 AAA family ATPase [Acetobacterium paludosum]
MAKIVAVFNQKGGVGKTTTNINLTTALSMEGYRILVIDIDPQGNTSSGFGIEKSNLERSVYNGIIHGDDLKQIILTTSYENLHILPSHPDLAGAEIELINLPQRELRLKNCIENVKAYYDYIFIDCPPSLGLLTINALAMANSVLIPIQCEFYALEGVSQLMNTISLVKQGLNPKLEIEGVLMTMFDSRTNLSNQVVDEVVDYFKDKVYETMIPRNIRLAEAPSYGQTIFEYANSSKGAKAYRALAKEFIQRQE